MQDSNQIEILIFFKDPQGNRHFEETLVAESINELLKVVKAYYRRHKSHLKTALARQITAGDSRVDMEADYELKRAEHDKTDIHAEICDLLDKLDNKYIFDLPHYLQ
jgi:hypothetical protein